MDENCGKWYTDFIREFRHRYNNLPETTRKFVWQIEDFNYPCQVISLIIHGRQRMTYLWVRKDPQFPDIDIRCYGPTTPDRIIETAEQILSNRDLFNELSHDKANDWPYPSYGKYLEEELVSISKALQKQLLISADLPTDFILGSMFSTPLNGFHWIVYGDITRVDREKIFKEIFDKASEREKTNQDGSDKPALTQPNEEEIVTGYSTYFYPPVWIGVKPVFDFRSKVNGIFIFPPPTYKTVYKDTMLAFNQKGSFFVGDRDKNKCIRFMNEIIGTAILHGYNLDVVTDLDIGVMTVTKDKGERRGQTYPKSITRYWQARDEIEPITENSIGAYTAISLNEILGIVKTAEDISVNVESSNHIVFYAHASQYVRDGKYQESFLFDWLIIERYLRSKWDSYLQNKNLGEKMRKSLSGWKIKNVLEEMSVAEKIDHETYDEVLSLKDIRNDLYHKGSRVSADDAVKCHKIAELMIQEETNMTTSDQK